MYVCFHTSKLSQDHNHDTAEMKLRLKTEYVNFCSEAYYKLILREFVCLRHDLILEPRIAYIVLN